MSILLNRVNPRRVTMFPAVAADLRFGYHRDAPAEQGTLESRLGALSEGAHCDGATIRQLDLDGRRCKGWRNLSCRALDHRHPEDPPAKNAEDRCERSRLASRSPSSPVTVRSSAPGRLDVGENADDDGVVRSPRPPMLDSCIRPDPGTFPRPLSPPSDDPSTLEVRRCRPRRVGGGGSVRRSDGGSSKRGVVAA
jgi:hypothetical protein